MQNLKKLREAHGMSQQKLADELFLTQQSIYKYENDLAYPNLETLKLMSQLFHTSIDYLVENENVENEFEKRAEILSEEERQIVHYFRKLSPKKKKAVLTLLSDN